ncbi:MAG: Bug family tripartite tricarboxylate transporter substrate binding protein, partial [Burkholderiales bacterium]
MNRQHLFRLSWFWLATSLVSTAIAQTYPTKPVRVLVGLGAGGGTDLMARIVTPKLTEAMGQPFIVENRVGAGGIIASDAVARATPDGYTILFSPSGVMVINPTMVK